MPPTYVTCDFTDHKEARCELVKSNTRTVWVVAPLQHNKHKVVLRKRIRDNVKEEV